MRKRTKRKIALFLVVLDIVAAYIYSSATSLIIESGQSNFESIISNCSYYAVDKCIKENFDFASVCTVEKTDSGDVAYIKTNTLLVNYLAKELALDCYDFVDKYLQHGVDVPWGVFTGLRLLSGMGSKINVKLISVASVDCRIVRTFSSAGINQTRQTLAAVIHTDITVITLFKKEKFSGDIEITVYDNLIVGKVPDTYLTAEVLGGVSR